MDKLYEVMDKFNRTLTVISRPGQGKYFVFHVLFCAVGFLWRKSANFSTTRLSTNYLIQDTPICDAHT
jgi:hypothetical protein